MTCVGTLRGEYCACFNTSRTFAPWSNVALVAASKSEPNCAKACISAYWASSSFNEPDTCFIALICAVEPTRDTDNPVSTAGLNPELNNSCCKKICPSVIEIPFVGIYAEISPACVSMIGKAVIDPPPFSSFKRQARSSNLECK